MHSNRQAGTGSGLIGLVGVIALILCTIVELRAEEPFVHWATTGPYSYYPGATAIGPAGELYTYFAAGYRLDKGLLRFSPTGELMETNKFEGVHIGGLVFDPAGNRYLTGSTFGTNGALGTAPAGFFVAKHSVSNGLTWLRGLDGADGSNANGQAIALDPQGNVHVIVDVSSGATAGLFLRKYDPDGQLLWSSRMDRAQVYGLSVDPFGSAVVWGFLTPASTGHSYDGDWFVKRYRPDGTLDWARLGYGKCATVDRSGNIYAGFDWAKDGLSGLVKLGPNGDVIWSKEFDAYVNGIAMDRDDEPVFCGEFFKTVAFGQFTLSADISVNEWYQDFFVAKVNADADFQWAMAGGGNDFDRADKLVCDGRGNIYLTGLVRRSTAYFDNLTLEPLGPEESSIFAAKLSEAPPLHISASPGSVDLTWPSKATDYVLEATTSILGASWDPVEGAPVGWGRDQTLNVATDSPAKFFRLRNP